MGCMNSVDILSIPAYPVKRGIPPVACGAADAVAELDEMPVRFGGDKARVAEPASCVFQKCP